MRTEDFLDAIGFLDDDLIEETDKTRKRNKKTKRWLRLGTLAACCCIMIGGLVFYEYQMQNEKQIQKTISDGSVPQEDGVIIPELDIDAQISGEEDVLPMFSYQGNSYIGFDGYQCSSNLLDQCLGRTKKIAEGSGIEKGAGEENLLGNIDGDIYSLKGYDPSLILCAKIDGKRKIFVHNNGISFVKGRELFEDGFHLRGNDKAIRGQIIEDWNHDKKKQRTLKLKNQKAIDAFFKAMEEADFIYRDDIDDTKEIGIIYIQKKDGLQVVLHLLDGGYVSCEGFSDVCVQVPTEIFEEICQGFQ